MTNTPKNPFDKTQPNELSDKKMLEMWKKAIKTAPTDALREELTIRIAELEECIENEDDSSHAREPLSGDSDKNA